MGLMDLFKKGKDEMDKRGGVNAAMEDANELKDVATSDKCITDKAKDAVNAVKEPGAPGAGQ